MKNLTSKSKSEHNNTPWNSYNYESFKMFLGVREEALLLAHFIGA